MGAIGESLNNAKQDLNKAIETISTTGQHVIPDSELRDILTRLQLARNALVQNERKIWLRTKIGKEMLVEFSEASARLLGVVESGSGFEEIKEALGDLELQAKRLNEETRRRSMDFT